LAHWEVTRKYGQFIDKLDSPVEPMSSWMKRAKSPGSRIYEILHVPDIEEVMTALKK